MTLTGSDRWVMTGGVGHFFFNFAKKIVKNVTQKVRNVNILLDSKSM
jgi:hypothetical protein